MKQKTMRILTAAFLIGTLCFIGFIFSNSLNPGESSGALSKAVVEFLNSIGIGVSELFVRKAAHFLEFLVFGILLSVDIRLITRNWWGRIFVPLFFSLLVPVFDEAIQLLVPGRSGEVRDVLIDFSGALTGMALMTLLIFLIADRRKKKTV